ncbi:MAG: hypothetical protein QOF60_1461 [Actinomycetota bacterium]|jgi:hypothetical protein|nr:hypothetical protein [Actinomycetota bacterium]
MSNAWGPDGEGHDDLIKRLTAFGRAPVPPAEQGRHLGAIATLAQEGRKPMWRRNARRAGVIATLGAGMFVATTGLAAAGALGPLQPVVAKGVEAATPFQVPKGPAEKANNQVKTAPAGFHGTARVTDGCVPATNGEFAINHGQYLKQERAKGAEALAAAKASDCGKPLATGSDDSTDPAATDNETDTGTNADHAPKTGGSPTADDHRVPKCTDPAATPPSEPGKPACTPGGSSSSGSEDTSSDASTTSHGRSGTHAGKVDGANGPPSTKAADQS